MSKVATFYTNWRKGIAPMLQAYITYNNSPVKPRFALNKLKKYLKDFLNETLNEQEKIILLPGLRGVGKTTLLAQLYFTNFKSTKNKFTHKLYISVDELTLNNISLIEFIEYLESVEWGSLVKGNKKILLLIDEIQYDKNWDLTLKILYDKTFNKKNLLIIATGSSAILIKKQNADLVRRSITYRILPERFSEFLSVHHNIHVKKSLSKKIRHAIFEPSSAKDVLNALEKLEFLILTQIANIDNFEKLKYEYLYKGALPFTANIKSTSVALDRIRDMLILNIVGKDLKLIKDLDADTLLKIPDLLYLLANSDEINLTNLINILQINSASTLRKILNVLVETELLYKVLPYGQPYKHVKKMSKYLFIAPSLRSALAGSINLDKIKGKLLEDYCALIFTEFLQKQATVMYDFGSIGADFIARFIDLNEIIIEVGFSKNTIKQVKQTLKKAKNRAKYGVVIGTDKLELFDENIVGIPLNYFMLI